MDVNGAVTPRTVLMAGEFLVAASAAAAAAVLVYFAYGRRTRTLRLITDDFRSFANDSVPYIINFSVCWYLSVALEKSITSSRLVAETTSEYYLPCKLLLNVTAFVTKHYLFTTRSSYYRTALFVANIALVATSEAMCHEKYEQTATRVTLILLFWLTVLILAAPENAYQNLGITEALTWKRCSLVYGLVTTVCHNWLKSGGNDSTFDTLLFVLVVHVQIIFLCVTYFSDGQQLLRNVVGRGAYNPMADSLDIYFTMDSIMSRMSVYLKNKSNQNSAKYNGDTCLATNGTYSRGFCSRRIMYKNR